MVKQLEKEVELVKEKCSLYFKEYKNSEGNVYYFNSKTGLSSWDKPTCLNELEELEEQLKKIKNVESLEDTEKSKEIAMKSSPFLVGYEIEGTNLVSKTDASGNKQWFFIWIREPSSFEMSPYGMIPLHTMTNFVATSLLNEKQFYFSEVNIIPENKYKPVKIIPENPVLRDRSNIQKKLFLLDI